MLDPTKTRWQPNSRWQSLHRACRPKRRLTARRAVKLAAAMGIEVTIAPDGAATFRPLGKDAAPDNSNPWDKALGIKQ